LRTSPDEITAPRCRRRPAKLCRSRVGCSATIAGRSGHHGRGRGAAMSWNEGVTRHPCRSRVMRGIWRAARARADGPRAVNLRSPHPVIPPKKVCACGGRSGWPCRLRREPCGASQRGRGALYVRTRQRKGLAFGGGHEGDQRVRDCPLRRLCDKPPLRPYDPLRRLGVVQGKAGTRSHLPGGMVMH
jgi:hypothetical protein